MSMAEVATELDADNCVTLIMQNDALEPTHLKKGQVLGRVYLTSLSPIAKQDLSNYDDAFALDSSELGSTDLVTHTIDTANHPPIPQQARRTPFALRDQIDEMVQKMVMQGVIEPSQSPWASPVLLVKDGSYWFSVWSIDASTASLRWTYSMTHWIYIQSTTLDLVSGHWQVKMHPESKKRTAFATWFGLHQCHAFATFQQLKTIWRTFRKCLLDCVLLDCA